MWTRMIAITIVMSAPASAQPGFLGRLMMFVVRGMPCVVTIGSTGLMRMLTGPARTREIGVLLSVQRRKLANEGHHCPYGVIVVRHSPCGHGCHLESVLDDPERLRRINLCALFNQARRFRI